MVKKFTYSPYHLAKPHCIVTHIKGTKKAVQKSTAKPLHDAPRAVAFAHTRKALT